MCSALDCPKSSALLSSPSGTLFGFLGSWSLTTHSSAGPISFDRKAGCSGKLSGIEGWLQGMPVARETGASTLSLLVP
ncbi:mCG148136 [Mus musculus]|nr:mCG148136 [Mus musculus]